MTSARKILLPVAAIAVLLILLAWMAGLFHDKIEPDLQAPLASNPAGNAVSVERSDKALVEPVPASVEARQATLISSRIMARITAVHVRAGDSVTVDQPLLELEQSDLLARVKQSRQRIRASQARLKEASSSLQRVAELHTKGLVATAQLDRAQANYDTLAAELAGARQALEVAETAVAFTEIRSPIEGRVVDRFAEPGDTATPGKKLLTLYNPTSLRIEARVREQLALDLYEGQALKVELPSLHKTLDAHIEERVPAAEPGSRSFLVKARVDFDKDLLPGMYARLLVPAGQSSQLSIPADRVVGVGQLNLVWVLVDDQPQRRFVRLGQALPDERVEVFAGLREGEQLLPPPL